MKWIQKYHADFVNGEGMREVIFLAGCKHQCKGCFNKESWDFNQGKEWTNKDTQELIEECKKEYISGVTFTGGDPLYSYKDLREVLIELKKHKINIWIYTGFEFESLILKSKPQWFKESEKIKDILNCIDVLCDGPFIEELKDKNKMWVGSSNQRVIDVQKSLQQNQIVLYKESN